jgi:hypothetical protein
MKIDFKTNSQGKIELENGHVLDSQILNFYDHDAFANGTGWVDLPEGLISGKDEFKGTINTEIPKMDAKGNIQTVVNNDPPVPRMPPLDPMELGLRFENGKLVQGNGLSQKEIDDYNLRYASNPTSPVYSQRFDSASTSDKYSIPGNPFSYEQNAFRDAYMQRAFGSMQTESLVEMFEKMGKILRSRGVSTVFTVTHPVEQKEHALYNLGFSKRTEGQYYHPILGQDLEQNWLAFNPEIDSLANITSMLYKSGFVKGQFKVRMDIKAALDIR